MEPPSRQLIDVLSRYALATPADLRRCRAQVRRLARDLPTFDSVWIDALTQARVLTPFQAKVLESEQPARLQIGPCVLVDEWEKDGRWTLYHAKHRNNGRRCLLTFVDVPPNDLPKALQQSRTAIATLRGLSHQSMIVPQGCDQSGEQIVVVSPHVAGPTLKQLLVRRGRFPSPVVIDIAWQLIDGLAALEDRDVVHGDVTLTSVRLTDRGQAVALHPGMMPAIGSRVSIHAPLGPQNYDGIAPELISTGRTATPQSDLYALGCLLWQLLAGRPPFPTGDPLAKLAAHQTRPIDDVLRWVPDAPPKLSALIRQLTAKNPAERGGGAKAVRDQWPFEMRVRRQRLAQFHSSFGTVAPRHGDVHRSASRFPVTAAAALFFILGGTSLTLLDAGARNELLRLASRTTGAPLTGMMAHRIGDEHGLRRAARGPSGASELRLLPSRPIDGVIELTSPGPYKAADLRVDGPLTIRGSRGVIPVIQIAGDSLRVSATQVTFEGVHFSFHPAHATAPVAVAVESQQLIVDRCRFLGPEIANRDETASPAELAMPTAIAWKVTDPGNPTGGKLLLRNTVIRGALHAVDTHAMPRSISVDNCLKTGAGALLRFVHSGRVAPLRVHLRQITLRGSGGVLRWSKEATADSLQPLLMIVENCVFDVPAETGAVLEFAIPDAPRGWERLIRITGEGSLLRAGTTFAACHVDRGSPVEEIDASQLRVEGLLIDDFEFVGEAGNDPSQSVIAFSQAPRSSPVPPGIDAGPLTAPAGPPIVKHAARP